MTLLCLGLSRLALPCSRCEVHACTVRSPRHSLCAASSLEIVAVSYTRSEMTPRSLQSCRDRTCGMRREGQSRRRRTPSDPGRWRPCHCARHCRRAPDQPGPPRPLARRAACRESQSAAAGPPTWSRGPGRSATQRPPGGPGRPVARTGGTARALAPLRARWARRPSPRRRPPPRPRPRPRRCRPGRQPAWRTCAWRGQHAAS